MKLAAICGRLALASLLSAVAACGGEGGGSKDGSAQVSTLAYVVSRCHEEKGGKNSSFSQTLWIRQGDGEPVKVMEFALGQPAIGGLCRKWGQSRVGGAADLVGAFQRRRFTPDGSNFFFEVTDDFSVNADVIPEDQQGIFVVRADGSGLRKIAPPSREPCFRVYWPCVFNPDAPGCATCAAADNQCWFGVSPDGRRIAFTDLGPGPTDEQASQLFTLDLTTDEPRPVTRLPFLPASPACVGEDTDCVFPSTSPVGHPEFLSSATMTYGRGGACSGIGGGTFTVQADGTEEPHAVPVVAVKGGAVVPVFQITGDPYPVGATLPGIPENGHSSVGGNTIVEVFAVEPPSVAQLPEGRVLQLTNFGRSDTLQPGMSIDWQRVVFVASDDPLGTNPSKQCQIFSIDRLGSDLRQVTFLSASGGTRRNCGDFASPGCSMGWAVTDIVTGALLFNSTCDLVGMNPTGVEQNFAIRLDGSGLTQLTRTAGVVEHADGSIDVEMARAQVPFR